MHPHRLGRKVLHPLPAYLQAVRSHGIEMVEELAEGQAMLVSSECAIETSSRRAIDRAFRSKGAASSLSFLTRAELTCLLDIARGLPTFRYVWVERVIFQISQDLESDLCQTNVIGLHPIERSTISGEPCE
jgi:hypothetical protein